MILLYQESVIDLFVAVYLLLLCRHNDSGRPGDGERPALPAFPASQLPGHSLQRDPAGPDRHEHPLHPAQRRHQDQGNMLTLTSQPQATESQNVFFSVLFFTQ